LTATLDRRQLGRATLARQLLLARVDRPVRDALEHLVGLQGQEPLVPHLSLWNRLTGYDPAELDALMTDRAVVRTQLMRTTIHTVTTPDALALRPVLQPVLDRVFAGTAWGQRLRGRDVSAAVSWARQRLAERPCGRAELARELAGRFPDLDAESVAYGVSYWVPWVQPPPRGLWTGSAAAVMAPLEEWVGDVASAVRPIRLEDLVRRHLAAFGPASVRDVQAWCGLTRLREVTDGMPELVRYRSEDGAELLDVPEGALPDPDTPAPVRFLAEYDNVTLSHADRSRVVGRGDHRPLARGPRGWVGTLLVDGLVSGTWAARPGDDVWQLTVRRSRTFAKAEEHDVEAEGRALVAFLGSGRRADVRFEG
jgi:hypothetical protein